MPLFVIERYFVEQVGGLTDDDVKFTEEINAELGAHWIASFLTADRRKTYCLYEAPSAEVIKAAAQRAGLPADVVVEVERIYG